MAYSCYCPARGDEPCPFTAAECVERKAKNRAEAHLTGPPMGRRKNNHCKHLALLKATGRHY